MAAFNHNALNVLLSVCRAIVILSGNQMKVQDLHSEAEDRMGVRIPFNGLMNLLIGQGPGEFRWCQMGPQVWVSTTHKDSDAHMAALVQEDLSRNV